MRKLLVAGAAVAALFGTPALAADMPLKAPPMAPPPACVWCGWYIGVNAGVSWSENDTITNIGTDTGVGGLGNALAIGAIPGAVTLRDRGALGGFQAGINWQTANWVFGGEADIDVDNQSNSVLVGPITVPGHVPITSSFDRESDWLATFRGRVGFTATPDFLIFGTGGLAVGRDGLSNVFICPTCGPVSPLAPFGVSESRRTATGWTAGGGFEWMFMPHVSLKAEYLYVDLGTQSTTEIYNYGAFASSLTSSVRNTENIARAGINWHF